MYRSREYVYTQVRDLCPRLRHTNICRKFVLMVIVMMFILSARAHNGYPGFNIGLGYGVGSGTDTGDSYEADRTSSISFASIGSTHEKGMYLGFRYEQQNIKYSSLTGKQTAQGVSLGIGQKGSYILAHYFWKITRELESGTMDGNGNGFDFGFQFPFVYKNYLTMGLQYSVRYTSYDDPHHRRTTVQMPMFVIGGNF